MTTYKGLTRKQALKLVDIASIRGDVTSMAINPFSGAMTVNVDRDTYVVTNQLGQINYRDSRADEDGI